jgi:ribosomal protein S18 acetylase RimI-like enzyme
MKLVPFDESMLPELLKIQHQFSEEKHWWSMEELRGDLLDGGRKHGKNVLILLEHDKIRGFAGYVDTAVEVGEFYIAPFVAGSKTHADFLILKIFENAHEARARMIRASAFPEEIKINALKEAGFIHILDFLTLEISLEKRIQNPDLSALNPLRRQTQTEFTPEKFQKLNNQSFRNVDNAPPMSIEDASDIWKAPNIRPQNLQIWATSEGNYVGYLMLSPRGNIESVAVSPDYQRKGLAKAMVSIALQEAFEAGFKTSKALISSRNTASLNLHQFLGFKECDRRLVFEKFL